MEISEAVDAIQLGAGLDQIYHEHRQDLLHSVGLDPGEVGPQELHKDTLRFMNRLCRHLGERHAGDTRVGAALEGWVRIVDEYDAFDALLSGFSFESRELVLRRGRRLFPGPLTAHWSER